MERQQLKIGDKLILEKEYTIVRTIGTGASSIVYLAEEIVGSNVLEGLKRYVIIKELYPKEMGICRKNQGDEVTRQHLLIPEASTDSFHVYKTCLRNAVQIQVDFRNHDETTNATVDMETVYEQNNTLYVVMGRVVGESYDKVSAINLTEVLTICRSITYAIGGYHKKGYLHLDVKPENVYKIRETNEIVKLFDFDTVHKKEDIQNERCTISYTMDYAAPELKATEYGGGEYEDIDERADIFSIGVILFEKIFGRLPDAEDMRPFKKWNFDESKLTKTESPQVKAALTQILRKTLALLKRKRYENTEELIVALDRVLQLARNRIYLCNHNVSVTASKSYYISRKDKVEEIRERLENYHIAYLCGVGGIGKSETAREYCEKYRSEYEIIYFVHYGISLKDTIAALNFVNLEDKELSVEERYRVKVYQLSEKELYNSNMLLVIDNYNVSPDSEEYEENVKVLKRLKELDVHILFTSRTESVDSERKICIDSLGLNELEQMFFAINSKDKTDDRRIAQVEELIETAFYHTLTVDLVAHQSVQIERYGKKTLRDYIDVLKENGLKNEIPLSVYNNKDDCEKNDVIYEHVKALFDFSALTEKERYVMVNACLLPMSGMETAEFCEFIDLAHFDDDSGEADWGEDEAITKLVNGGWIRRSGEFGERICLHPVVSEVVVNELAKGNSIEKWGNILLSLAQIMYQVRNNYHLARKYIDIIKFSSVMLSKISESVVVAQFLDLCTQFFTGFAFYESAFDCGKKALGIRNKVLQENHLDIAASYAKLGVICAYLEKYEEELEYGKKTLEIRENVLPEDHLDIALAYINIADAYDNLWNHNHALYYRLKARVILLENSNRLDLIADLLEGIGTTYHNLAAQKEALEFYLKALTIRERITPLEERKIALLYYRISNTYNCMKMYNEAMEYAKKALEIRKRVLFENHHEIASSYQIIGSVYAHQGEGEKALKYYMNALYIYNEIMPDNHPDVMQLYILIGDWYNNIKNYDKALEYYKKALKIGEEKLLPIHPKLARIYKGIRDIYRDIKDWDKSLEYEKKYYEIEKRYLFSQYGKSIRECEWFYSVVNGECD